MGLKNYRLSIAMPRVLPGATGPPNEDGIAFYNRLIDCLLAANITPCVRQTTTAVSIAAPDNVVLIMMFLCISYPKLDPVRGPPQR